MRGPRGLLVCTLIASLVALPAVAFADMIVPAFFFAVPGMILIIIPIIVLEGLVLSRFLGLDWRQALKVSTFANVASTLVGIPATWLAYALIDYAVSLPFSGIESASASNTAFLFSGWVGNRTSGFPPVSVTLLVMVVPFFFGSWFVEYRVARRMLPDCDRHHLNRAVLIGNLASYALVAMILVVFYFNGT